MMHGVMVSDGTVMVTDAAHGLPIVEVPEPSAPTGYHAEGRWSESGGYLVHSYELVPDEGSAEQAALALSRLQYQSLPYSLAYELRALAPRYEAGQAFAAGTRFLDGGALYTADEDFVAPTGVRPSDESVPCTVAPDPAGAEPWSEPTDKHTYRKGSLVTHADKLWRSRKNNNTEEPGAGDRWEEVA